jgi:drug/metabolite transporter (DMT)-like permease
MDFIWLYTFFGVLENHETFLTNQEKFENTVFPALGLGTLGLGVVVALVYYAGLNRFSPKFKTLGWWVLMLVLAAALAFGFALYQASQHTEADTDSFVIFVGIINAVWAVLFFFLASLVCKRHPITLYAQNTPF